MKRLLSSLTILATAAAALTACSLGGDDSEKPTVVTALYPLTYLTEQIGADHISVSNLTKPGAEPHDLEITARQAGKITDADLVVYLDGFQPGVDDAVAEYNKSSGFNIGEAVELHEAQHEHENEHAGGAGEEGHDHGDTDPHFWLDPTKYAEAADAIAKKLGQVETEHADEFRDNAEKLKTQLTKIDTKYQNTLSSCEIDVFITSHAAFGYLADRYNLEQVAVSGLDPESEPNTKRLAKVAQIARDRDVRVIFFETLVSDKVAQTLADEANAETDVLDPLEGIQEGSSDTYMSVMEKNLRHLSAALRCS